MENHNHTGEQYPEEIKPIMDKGEERIARIADNAFSKWNTKLASWAKNITSDINKENEKRVKKSKAVLEVPNEKIEEGIKDILKPEDFELNLKPLKGVMEGAVSNELNRIRSQIGQNKRVMKSDDSGVNIGIDWDIEYDTSLYDNIIDMRATDLAEMLHADSVSQISDIIKKATTEGWSEKQLMDALQETCGFDKTRSQRIGRTEANYAANQAILKQTHRIGIEEYNISAAPDACEECQSAAEEGPYDYSEASDLLPVHPSCRCVLQSVIPDEWLEEPELTRSIEEVGDDLLIKSEQMNDAVIANVAQRVENLNYKNEEKVNELKEEINNGLESVRNLIEELKQVSNDGISNQTNITKDSVKGLSENENKIYEKLEKFEKSLKKDIEEIKKKEVVSPKELRILKSRIEENEVKFTNLINEAFASQPDRKDFITTETPFEGLPLILRDRIAQIEEMIKTLTIYVPSVKWGSIQGDINNQKDLNDTFLKEETDPIYSQEKSLYVTKNDSSDVKSISSLDRNLYDVNGNKVYDWHNGIFTDTNGNTQIDLSNMQLFTTNGSTNGPIADWNLGYFGVSAPGGYKASLNADNLASPHNYTFPDKDGTFAMLDDLRFASVINQSVDYSVGDTDRVVRFTATATLTIPYATGSGRIITVICDADSAIVTVTNGVDTIDRELSQSLYDGDSMTIIDVDSGAWNII